MRTRLLIPLVTTVALVALTGCGDDETATSAGEQEGASGAAWPTHSPTGPACAYEPDGQEADVDLPADRAVVSGEVPVTFETSIGDLSGTLDADGAPCTVNSFVSLAQQGFFDATTCHRMTVDPSSIFVLQCGDPTGTGTGGPGYTIEDELTGEETYPAGTLAMANTGYPDTGGSQFFLVYDDTPLPPSYTVFGTVDEAAVEAVRDVAAEGTDDAFGPGDGHPTRTVEIEAVTPGS